MIRILSSVFLWLFLVMLVIISVPLLALLRALTFPFDPNKMVPGRVLRHVGSLCFRMNPLWWGRVEGKLPDLRQRAHVLVSNHESNVDVLFLSRLPYEMKWLCKAEMFDVPWFGLLFRLSGDIPVQREQRAAGRAALERCAHYLQRGVSLMIFPEGTRSRTGELGAFKPGAFRLAIQQGCPVVPIAIHGTSAGMPVGSPWLNWARPVARILAPISTEGLTEADVSELTERVRAAIAEARQGLAAEAAAKGAAPKVTAPAASPVVTVGRGKGAA